MKPKHIIAVIILGVILVLCFFGCFLLLQRYLCLRLGPTDNDRYIAGIAVIVS